MDYYELMVILDASIAEEQWEEKEKEIESLITAKSGVIIKNIIEGRKRFTYSIKKKDEGVYIQIYFDLDKSNVKTLEKELFEKEEILRFLLVKEKKGRVVSTDVPETYSYT